MANNTYVLLGKVTLAASASSITFSNIPQTGYTDLVIKCSVRSDRASSLNSYMRLYPNGSSSSITLKALTGNGSSAGSQTESAASAYVGEINASTSTASTFSNVEIYIPNYAGSTNKSYSVDAVMENNATTAYVALVADLWSNTTAISSIQLLDALGNFVQYSDFYLYGISNVNATPTVAPSATGGDIITNDGTYWYHAFLSSGTFTPLKTLSCNMLVVAGGGGGGWNAGGGGGGAGGLLALTSQSLSTINYTVTVGAGGAAAVANGNRGSVGNNSVFSSSTALGGGGGQGGSAGTSDGGSGGGGATDGGGTSGTSGAGTVGQGNNGGIGNFSGSGSTRQYAGGGGGGAGAVGVTASAGVGGNGGAGSNTYSTWATTTSTGISGYYAGGGGGGAGRESGAGGITAGNGGAGGGGNGAGESLAAIAGIANTGGGGGGGNNGVFQRAAAAGGSGIVIVRYAM